jgi:hypothetical protein
VLSNRELDAGAQEFDGVQVLSNAERMAEGETHAVNQIDTADSSDETT